MASSGKHRTYANKNKDRPPRAQAQRWCWAETTKRERARERRVRQGQARVRARSERLDEYNLFDARERWAYGRNRDHYKQQVASKRRAVLIHADGALSGIKLLPYTPHEHGVIGSFLGGVPRIVASCTKRKLVLMSIQDEICDEEWSDKANLVLYKMGIHKLVATIYGRALLVRMAVSDVGQPMVADLPLDDDHFRYYPRQTHATYDPHETGEDTAHSAPPSGDSSPSSPPSSPPSPPSPSPSATQSEPSLTQSSSSSSSSSSSPSSSSNSLS